MGGRCVFNPLRHDNDTPQMNRAEVLFPNVNVKIIYSIAACYLIGNICDDNISTALICGDNGAFLINSDTLLYAALLVIFALIYKVAVKVSEENNLTI